MIEQDPVVQLWTHKCQYHKVSSFGLISCCPLQLHGQPYPALPTLSPTQAVRLFSSHTATPCWPPEVSSCRLLCACVCSECLLSLPNSFMGQTLTYLIESVIITSFVSAIFPSSPFQDRVSLSLLSALIVPRGSQWESNAAISWFLACLSPPLTSVSFKVRSSLILLPGPGPASSFSNSDTLSSWDNIKKIETLLRNQGNFMDLLPSQTSKPNSKGYIFTKTYTSFQKPTKPLAPHFPSVLVGWRANTLISLFNYHTPQPEWTYYLEKQKHSSWGALTSLRRHLSVEVSINCKHKVPDGAGFSQSLYTWTSCISIINRSGKCQYHMNTH